MTARIDRLTAELARLEADAILITDEINVRYLSGFTGDSSYLIVTPTQTSILTDRRYESQVAAECPQLHAAVRASSDPITDLIQQVVAESQIVRLAFESAQLTVSQWDEFRRQLPAVQWVAAKHTVEQLRCLKDAAEIEILRSAVRIAERAFQSVIPKLTPRWQEREVAFELEATMRTLGADGVSFAPIVAAEPAGALPHYRPRDVQLGATPTLLVDWGASFRGYASDLTRTLHTSTASPAFQAAYEAVLESQLAAIEMIQPGVSTRDVDAAARKVLDRAGLGEAFKHGLGHGIGLQIHESPRLSPRGEDLLAAGMVVTVEPGVYFEGEFGIRIEDDVLVTESGHEILSTIPKGLDESRLIL